MFSHTHTHTFQYYSVNTVFLCLHNTLSIFSVKVSFIKKSTVLLEKYNFLVHIMMKASSLIGNVLKLDLLYMKTVRITLSQ